MTWQYGQHQTKRQAREKTERMEELSVSISQAMLIAGFHHPKITSHNDNWEYKYIPYPILTPLLNILDFALRAACNRHF